MPLSYKIRKYLQSNFGKLRTGDRVVVVNSWAQLYLNEGLEIDGKIAYTGTVQNVVYNSITVLVDHGFYRNAAFVPDRSQHTFNELRDNVHRI
ncbi:hypothetical protein SEA_STARBOW_275 [Streptomyces phage Starbow]|nr:hypothetical protein HWB80_gp018 [Streptomyces phage Karimac]YP_009840405.1 hypothetical protein HWB80_gp047 [Streptomyces phage Karimac]AXH66529.1 hypothetical protein SEA_STARBOW_18 [Streptomyces phage Starbow]QGH74264.1 hypothetical protein SEA_WIPEOUT_17 [Streptomyces phage Wipeout]URM87546.1 hypothetical protein SEA_QUARAN19_18 [Streptomyces phage Quaran19]AXH66738.1 hypothetical protein SEA_STARBOW_275 [Streptomyces phage Starbow]AXH69944.1 hypothetical protein SEA_KARIMAC_18 [Strept